MARETRYNAAVAAYSAAMATNADTATMAALARTIAAIGLPFTADIWATRAAYLESHAPNHVAG